MAIMNFYGHGPDLFITFTANPKWPEIVNELQPGELPHNRPDLITRVFHEKLQRLIELLTKEVDKKNRTGIFGKSLGNIHTIEYQKRTLPHAHILLFLDRRSPPYRSLREPKNVSSWPNFPAQKLTPMVRWQP